jgi:LPXTG-site transpeptidase (sortase) family protein
VHFFADMHAMRHKRVAGLLVVLCTVAVMSSLFLRSDRSPESPDDSSAAQVRDGLVGTRQVRPIVRPGAPTMLRLPRLGVAAPAVRVDSDHRELVPPSDYTTVGWWETGAAPGASQGTALIVGHTVHTGGGALDKLGDMHRGDRVIVDRSRDDLVYRVSSVRTYGKASFGDHAEQILSQNGPSRLAIVTCGNWNGDTFLTNIVVIATRPKVIG